MSEDRLELAEKEIDRLKGKLQPVDFIQEFAEFLEQQLIDDQARWGDTWRYRPIEGQVDRIMARFRDYADQHNRGGQPFPWLKVAGEALIGWARENYPDYFLGGDNE